MRGRKDEAKEAFLLLDGLVTLSLSLSLSLLLPVGQALGEAAPR